MKVATFLLLKVLICLQTSKNNCTFAVGNREGHVWTAVNSNE